MYTNTQNNRDDFSLLMNKAIKNLQLISKLSWLLIFGGCEQRFSTEMQTPDIGSIGVLGDGGLSGGETAGTIVDGQTKDLSVDMELADMELADMELVDMELVDMELADMELVDMELADMELPSPSLQLGAPCRRNHNITGTEERCEEGLECFMDQRFLPGVSHDDPPLLGVGTCEFVPNMPPQEVPNLAPCDIEEVRVRCSGQGVCFDPVEALSRDDSRAQNKDGSCLTAHPIFTQLETREVFLLERETRLYQLIAESDFTLDLTLTGVCDQGTEVSLLLSQVNLEGEWDLLELSSSAGLPDEPCPSINMTLSGGELFYVALRFGEVTGALIDPAMGTPSRFELTFSISLPDRDGDGTSDEYDCEPDNPNIPAPEEILNNGIDDDCNLFTPDTELMSGEACNRSDYGLGCIDPLFCLQSPNDGIGICGDIPDFPSIVTVGDRCDVYEVENYCDGDAVLFCFDGALYVSEGLEDRTSPETASLTDGDGRCVQLIDSFSNSGEEQLALGAGEFAAISLFPVGMNALNVTLLPPQDGEGCSFSPEIKIFRIDEGVLFPLPVYLDSAGPESGDGTACARVTIPEIYPEMLILVNEQDPDQGLECTLQWGEQL